MVKRTKPGDRHILTAEVLRTERISPNVVRVTAGGAGLDGLDPMGADQWFRMFWRKPGCAELRLPSATSSLWYAQYLMIPKEVRPVARNLTIREFRRDDAASAGGGGTEIDIDFFVHGDTPASTWVENVAKGETFGMLDEGILYAPTSDAHWQLIVGDESALPAVAGILASAPLDLRAEVFVEIPHADDAQELRIPDGVTVHWLVRTDPQARPGALALETVKAAELPDGPAYAYVAGESSLVTGLRRHLVNERHMPKRDVSFTGYWKYGKSAG